MKQEAGILLKAVVLRRAKRRAADEGRPLRDLLQDALEKYLIARLPEPAHPDREAAIQLCCGQPIKLSAEQFKAVIRSYCSVGGNRVDGAIR